jgi:hypothetical protein
MEFNETHSSKLFNEDRGSLFVNESEPLHP